jgi:hypothetical protein
MASKKDEKMTLRIREEGEAFLVFMEGKSMEVSTLAKDERALLNKYIALGLLSGEKVDAARTKIDDLAVLEKVDHDYRVSKIKRHLAMVGFLRAVVGAVPLPKPCSMTMVEQSALEVLSKSSGIEASARALRFVEPM